MLKYLANWWNLYIYCTPLNWKLTMNTPPMHVLCKRVEWTYVLHTCRSCFFSICHPASHPNSHSLSHSAFFTLRSLVGRHPVRSREKYQGGSKNLISLCFSLLDAVFGGSYCISSGVVLSLGSHGLPSMVSTCQTLMFFPSWLLLPGNSRDLMLWQVSRRPPHFFPQVCQCFYQ